MQQRKILLIALSAAILAACSKPDGETSFDAVITGGTVYDGSGGPGFVADIGIVDDRIAKIGDLSGAEAGILVDARGKAVSPGFINMLSWGALDLIIDGRGMSDLKQGVTLEVFGEGTSLGPTSPAMIQQIKELAGINIPFLPWRTLGQALWLMEKKGVSLNIASFVGGATIRMKHLGFVDRAPTADELAAMREDVRIAMEEGAMGLGTSLIYPPGFFASTEDLTALAEVVGEYGGLYTSHMRSEANALLEAIDEVIHISREAGVDANIYHLKAAGYQNWYKMDLALQKIEEARAEGLNITADMYMYVAAGTGLDSTLPPSSQEGGYSQLLAKIKNPKQREELILAMTTPDDSWEQMYLQAGGGEGIMVIDVESSEFGEYVGKTVAEIAEAKGTSEPDTILNILEAEGKRVFCIYFLMTEDNVVKQIRKPWVALNSDAGAPSDLAASLKSHPRGFGTFARLLAKYVRDDEVISLPDAVRRLTSLPADNLKLKDRGRLVEGAYADIVVFDAGTIQDHATFKQPNQFATGVEHVFVNGGHTLKNGEHNAVFEGRFVRGPGYQREG
ncbi:MAG: D-aminoacylase [Pseudomonadota bacterium]